MFSNDLIFQMILQNIKPVNTAAKSNWNDTLSEQKKNETQKTTPGQMLPQNEKKQ